MELVIDGREVTACQLECAETTPSGGDPAADDPSAVPLLDGGADSVQVERKILLPADLEFDLVGIFPRFLQLGKAPLGRDMESIAPLLQREVDPSVPTANPWSRSMMPPPVKRAASARPTLMKLPVLAGSR